jgi:hypothetical protein
MNYILLCLLIVKTLTQYEAVQISKGIFRLIYNGSDQTLHNSQNRIIYNLILEIRKEKYNQLDIRIFDEDKL